MPVSANTLRILMAGGLAGDALVAAVEAIDADMESMKPPAPVRTLRQERNARYYQSQKSKRLDASESRLNQTSDSDVLQDGQKVNDCTALSTTSENNLTKYSHPSGVRNARTRGPNADEAEFDVWYALYPHKVGKGAARKSFTAARRKAPLERLIEGLRHYIASKPADREWCNPATWLNQERWNDQPAPIFVPQASGSSEPATGPPPVVIPEHLTTIEEQAAYFHAHYGKP